LQHIVPLLKCEDRLQMYCAYQLLIFQSINQSINHLFESSKSL